MTVAPRGRPQMVAGRATNGPRSHDHLRGNGLVLACAVGVVDNTRSGTIGQRGEDFEHSRVQTLSARLRERVLARCCSGWAGRTPSSSPRRGTLLEAELSVPGGTIAATDFEERIDMAGKKTHEVPGVPEIDFNSDHFLKNYKQVYMDLHGGGCPLIRVQKFRTGAYPFAYSGLTLLLQSGGNLFLTPTPNKPQTPWDPDTQDGFRDPE